MRGDLPTVLHVRFSDFVALMVDVLRAILLEALQVSLQKICKGVSRGIQGAHVVERRETLNISGVGAYGRIDFVSLRQDKQHAELQRVFTSQGKGCVISRTVRRIRM